MEGQMNKHMLYTATILSLLPVFPACADHVSIGGAAGTAGPVTTIRAETLPQGQLAASLVTEFVKSDEFSDERLAQLAGQHIHAHSTDYMLATSLGLAYGLTSDLTLGLRLPWVYRDNIRAGVHSHGPGGDTAARQGDSGGIGDLTVLGKYRFYSDEQDRWQAAMLFGLKMPTGETGNRHDGANLEAEHQPGSGSWDPLIGFAATRKAGPAALDASVLYAMATEGSQDTDLGDRVAYNMALSYRLGGELHYHEPGVPHQHEAWDLVLELNGEWAGEKEIEGEADDDSGGNQIFLSPGIRYTAGAGWAVQLSAGAPVVSNMGAGHPDTAYRITAGISRAF